MNPVDRMTLALAAALLSPCWPATATDSLDLKPGAEQLDAYRKIQCSTVDGRPTTYWWLGKVYSRVPGERDRVLFQVEGMNIRQCGTVNDEERGAGMRLVTREILLYKDPKTGEVVDRWQNPWTNETVDIIHVTNDPVNQPGVYPIGNDGKPFSLPVTVSGNKWWLTSAVPLFYTNPLGGDYQQYVGGTYHATEMFNFIGEVDDITNPKNASADVTVGWVRISRWLPWMRMGDRPGILYFHTAGRKVGDYANLPDSMREVIAARWPEYTAPPPINDQRPNETSWTYFKKTIDAQR